MTEAVAVQMDLAVADVHKPATANTEPDRDLSISAAKRKSLSEGSFALPGQRKYPLDTAARTRNAAARLEQMHKRGKVSDSEYKQARARIATAAKKFGIESEYNASDSQSAGPARPPDRRKRVPKTIHVRADLAPGGALHVRHMRDTLVWENDAGTQRMDALADGGVRLRDVRAIKRGDEVDPATLGITLKGPATWKDGSPKKLVWVQIAEVGAWRGHSAGAFSLTPATFSEICSNFEKRGLPVPFDFEHASEQDPTSGSIPEKGAKAPGWTHRLENRGIGGLWGLVEWFDYARDGIQAGEFGYLSPAIRFDTKDPTTGAPAGAKLTSVAITNQPFLTKLAGLVAAKDTAGGVMLRGAGGLDRMIGDPHDYLPKIKTALRLHPLATSDEMGDHLDRLRELCMSAGPTGIHEGVDLSEYTEPLRAICGAGPADSWGDVFDRVQDMIDDAIARHEERYHEGSMGASMSEGAAASATTSTTAGPTSTETTTMATEAELTVKLTDANTRATTAETALATMRTDRETVATQLKDMTTRATTAESTVQAATAAIQLREGEALAAGIARIVAENVQLLKDKGAREEADLLADVDIAFATYKDVRKLTESDKAHMLSMARADRKGFNGMFPPVAPDQRHLLLTVPPEKRPTEAEELSFTGLTKKLMSDGMSYADACVKASKLLSNSQAQR